MVGLLYIEDMQKMMGEDMLGILMDMKMITFTVIGDGEDHQMDIFILII